MGTMGLIHDQDLSAFVSRLRNGLYITADAVIVGGRQNYRLCIGMLFHATDHLLWGNAPQNPVLLDGIRIGVYRRYIA